MSGSSNGKKLDLVRDLGPWASAAIVVGTMIGTGIFLKPAEMAREGGFVAVVFAAWIVGAILSNFGALSYALSFRQWSAGLKVGPRGSVTRCNRRVLNPS